MGVYAYVLIRFVGEEVGRTGREHHRICYIVVKTSYDGVPGPNLG
jgi:hypothetical protein